MGIAQLRWKADAGRGEIWRWLADEMAMPALLATPARPPGSITLPAPLLAPENFQAMVALLGPDRVRQDDAERMAHAFSQDYADLLRRRAGDTSSAPDAVLWPRSEDEVLAILKFAAAKHIGVVPFGGGTASSDGVHAGPGKIALDLSGMSKMIAVDVVSGTLTAEAGIRLSTLESLLAPRGLSCRLTDPGQATLGGRIAMSRICDGLVSLRLATAHGVLAGAELKAMIAGSEGTLGVITQATLRVGTALHPRAWLLRDFASGLAALREALRQEIRPQSLYLSDAGATQFTRQFLAKEEKRSLWLEDLKRSLRRFDSGAATLHAGFSDPSAARRFDLILRKLEASALENAAVPGPFLTPARREALLDHGAGVLTIETAAGWSRLPALYAGVTRALDAAMKRHVPRAGAKGRVLAHVSRPHADGAALTLTAIFPRDLNNEFSQADAIRRAALDAVIAQSGSLIGIGQTNLPWVEKEKGALAIAALRGIKQALDPENILNPGKRLPQGARPQDV
jgi:alkyldihydroxyacetonephosphate synthase